MLQSADYVNQVFYAGRDLESTRRAVPLGNCDYVVTDPAVLETEKGAALVAILAGGSTLEDIGAAGPFVVLRRR